MPKVCTSCGFTEEAPKKPDTDAEDCPDCGLKETMKKKEDSKTTEDKQEN